MHGCEPGKALIVMLRQALVPGEHLAGPLQRLPAQESPILDALLDVSNRAPNVPGDFFNRRQVLDVSLA
jgi:hypothetical protein